MKEKELRKLSRKQLLEMLILQTERTEQLEHQLEDVNEHLEDRTIKINKAGSIAEAALSLSGVFESAQDAADRYLENIRRLEEKQRNISDSIDQTEQNEEES